jgi:hypothetical protein
MMNQATGDPRVIQTMLRWLSKKTAFQAALELDDALLTEHLKTYTILNCRDNPISELLDQCDPFVGIFLDSDRYHNNKLQLRAHFLFLVRMMRQFIDAHGNSPESTPDLSPPVLPFFTLLGAERIEAMYNRALGEVTPTQRQCGPGTLVDVLRKAVDQYPAEHPLLMQLETLCAQENPNICLYPSANEDELDLNYFDAIGNALFAEQHIFVHVDLWHLHNLPYANEESVVRLSTRFSEDSFVCIQKRNKDDRSYWLITFSSTQNEQLLQSLIHHRIRIDTLFSKCDGITSGMGHGREDDIPTPLYACFAEALALSRIITEYGMPFFQGDDGWINRHLVAFKNCVQNHLDPELAETIMARIEGLNFREVVAAYGSQSVMDDNHSVSVLSEQYFNQPFYLITF